MNKKYCSIIQIYILSVSMHIQNLIEIHKLIHKLLRINKILMSIKSHNSVKNRQKKQCTLDITWTLHLSMHRQNLIKIHPFVLKILRKNTFLHQSRAITLLKMNEKYCSIIQIYILSISMHIQNLIEIHKSIHKLLSINKVLMLIKDHNSVKN